MVAACRQASAPHLAGARGGVDGGLGGVGVGGREVAPLREQEVECPEVARLGGEEQRGLPVGVAEVDAGGMGRRHLALKEEGGHLRFLCEGRVVEGGVALLGGWAG